MYNRANLSFDDNITCAAIVAIINQKFAENYENQEKAEVLTEILNDIKFFLTPPKNQEIH
jgi:phosphosulfolactate phosphohydrolase-like enzyme|tara:strand:+ start:125 stop:304 length:180 start_codon:yes stop_codon:yes gene_type:complete